MSVDEAATKILQRAVELDTKKRYTEALVCYQEGIQILIDLRKDGTEEKRSYLLNKIEEYMKRAERIKEIVNDLKEQGKYSEQVNIENNSTGHGYDTIFGRFLDNEVTSVKVEDPYIRSFHQCQNFLKLCELVVKKCKHIKLIELLTSRVSDKSEQVDWLITLQSELIKYNVQLNFEFSPTLHDRQIIINTGWIIKLGRGLDYFKPPETKFSLGVYDMDFRPCHETTVNIFHNANVKQSYS